MSDLDEFLAGLESGPAGLAVDADLELQLTVAGSSTTARITGSEQRVRVDAQRPEVFLAAVGRADVGRMADLLAATGITVDVHGPRGPVASLGAGTGSLFGRVLTGSSRVAPVAPAAVPLVRGNRVVRLTAAALAALLAVLVVSRARPR